MKDCAATVAAQNVQIPFTFYLYLLLYLFSFAYNNTLSLRYIMK